MEAVPLPDRHCRLIGDDFSFDGLVTDLVSVGVIASSSAMTPTVKTSPLPAPSQAWVGRASVWVVCETQDDGLARASAELLSKAT